MGFGSGMLCESFERNALGLVCFAFQFWVLSGLGLGQGRAGLPAGALSEKGCRLKTTWLSRR